MAKKHDRTKLNGVHYTPTELASFLARVTYQALTSKADQVDVMDPACGDGGLLEAIADACPPRVRKKLRLFGFERDRNAVEAAKKALSRLNVKSVEIEARDFLDMVSIDRSGTSQQLNLFGKSKGPNKKYDVVIANPPYVRTQVLGAAKAQALGKKFGITGRVDLYHAFSVAMANSLREGGVLGLLTSNRFLTIKSGMTLRRFLHQQFDLEAVYDLGDTKLFKAAVLPVIVVGRKNVPDSQTECNYVRIYEHRDAGCHCNSSITDFDQPLTAVQHPTFSGLAHTKSGTYRLERGILHVSGSDDIWTLATTDSRDWMSTVERHQHYRFDDVAQVRVGIKTTADNVFIRQEWKSLPKDQRPEKSLIHPLITHHNAERWTFSVEKTSKSVVYPHEIRRGKKATIDLAKHPNAACYFESFSERLRSRKYVIDAGRQWYEMWVPHNPADWKRKKVVFPDISERPTFFLDETGSIVNGDCYWITTKHGFDDEWLYLILAVANSSFITKYYDTAFHNKLYAGRRRFMTQYVKQFPLPQPATRISKQIINNVKKLVRPVSAEKRKKLEITTDNLVWAAFGLTEEIAR